MGPEKKVVISLPKKNREINAETRLFWREVHRDWSGISNIQTLHSVTSRKILFLYLWPLKGIIWTKLMTTLSLVHSTTLSHRAQHWIVPTEQRTCGPSSWGFPVSGTRSASGLLPCALYGILLGDTNTNQDTFAHTRSDLSKSWG